MPRNFIAALCLAAAPLLFLTGPVNAADHRDAPGVDGAGEGDITDVFAFLDPTDASKLVLAMGVNPFAVPGAGPTYRFSPDYLYQFKIDRYGTYKEDFVVQVQFQNTPTGQQATVNVGSPDPNAIGAVNQPLLNPNSSISGPVGGVFGDPNSIQAFTGLRDDPFVFDLAQFNRILAGTQDVFRDIPSSPLGHLRGRSTHADGTSGIDAFAGFNASYIVVEFPVSWLGVNKIINVWGTISAPSGEANGFTQFERMGQPAFNTVFIPKALKDAFNQGVPSEDVSHWSQFVPDALTTTDNDGTGNTISGRAGLLTALGLNAAPNGAPLLLPSSFANTSKDLLRIALLPDVLRLDLSRESSDLGIGAFGVTNGRRPGDDVIDIELRLLRQLADVNFPAALKVPGSGTARAGALTLGDPRITAVLQGTDFIRTDSTLSDVSVSGNDQPFLKTFPFFAAPNPLPGEPGTVSFPSANALPSGDASASLR
ncbi:MAG TPA: DUF4331 family protein [Bryobacteraceae bacterium]